jgi:hypothetical protein
MSTTKGLHRLPIRIQLNHCLSILPIRLQYIKFGTGSGAIEVALSKRSNPRGSEGKDTFATSSSSRRGICVVLVHTANEKELNRVGDKDAHFARRNVVEVAVWRAGEAQGVSKLMDGHANIGVEVPIV